MDFAVIICTPNTVQRGLVNRLLFDLKETTNYRLILRHDIWLNRQDIEIIYPQLVDSVYFPMIVECLTSGKAEIIIVAESRIHEKINKIKGKFNFSNGKVTATGLRLKYCINSQTYDFIFHSTDSNRESYDVGVRLCGEKFLNAFQHELI